MLPLGKNSKENPNEAYDVEVHVIQNIAKAIENIRVATPVVTPSSHAIDIVESIRNKLLLLVQTDDQPTISSKGKECIWLLRNGRDIVWSSDIQTTTEVSDHKAPEDVRYAAGLLVVFAETDSYTDSMEDILVYTAYKECRNPTLLKLNQVEVNYLQAFGKRWSNQMKEAAFTLSEGRPSMANDVYEKFLALGSYNDVLSKVIAKTRTSLILTSSAKIRLGYWAHIYKGRKGSTSTPVKSILGRESNLLKRKEFSIGMTDSQRINSGVQPGDGWRISLLFLLAVSRQYPDYISKTLARNTGGYLERGRGHGNLWAPRVTSDQLADCGVFMSNARDAGYGLSFHLESLVSAALSVNDQSTIFQDTIRLCHFVSIMCVDGSWHLEDFQIVSEPTMEQSFDHVVTNHIMN
ncbi:hypothetical protein K450DRAFT_254020 [Umbelopsis ramanniana AG]|uniref:Uncharacterized protein n=1 Tax=Umbelopsis ramanniana AG TaxID=1314678 RepID=A0AAD5HAK0_UMBRA|nr:uncharacterized protein K450DRAFT_254020 [Umbelopsis ramanniana AG]KAI8577022.1 hypothetical protein K450DRAFT_254020 [Umbelopsis ramanniana AG]